ncbi:right-handed parallel beta-helix repeat-containing protein [Candidatus Woesearchaeota archaeon]|nr:right-handed parallel beta-helix repeat-containing protein [Candidatus Woesearchaeota archaeon]
MLIGNRDDGLRPVNGSIDEVRIWNRSLTLDEIIAHNASRYFELQSTETQVGDAWQCAVTPNDGSSDGTMLNSSAVVVSGCTTAYDDFYLNANTVLCGGAQFSVTDSGASGVLIVNRSNILLDCNASIINGSKSYTGYGIYNDRFDNITVKNCVIEGYFNALFFVNSSQHNISGNTLSRNRKRPNSNDSGDFIDVWEIPPNTDDGGGGIFLWYVNRSVVSWNNMTDQQNGLQLYNSDRNNITDNNMSDNQGWGIQLDNASYNFVSNNNADDVWNKNSTYCVGVQDNGCDTAGLLILRSSDNNTIVNNTIRQGGDSYFGAGASAAADMLGTNGNYVADNDFSYAWHHGVEHTFAKNNVFERNNVSNARRNGFWLGYSEYTIVRENDMSNDSWGAVDNEMGRHNLYLNNTIFKGGDGIVLYNTNTTNNTIANNTILNTTAEGIKLQNDSFTRIIGNTISGNPVSISIEMASYNVTVLNNSITAPDSATHAVLITRSDNVTFRGNDITTTAVPAFLVSQSDNLKVFNGPLNVPLTVNDTELMNDSDNARFINVSFDVWNVSVSGDSSLYVGYYLGVNVSNDTGPAANANVTAFGANRSTAFSALTDSSGLVSDQELIQFRVNGSTFNYTDYSLYTVNATWNGLTKNQTVNMTSSQNLVFLFINGPLISGVPNRTINMSFSPPDAWYNLTVNTTDVDNLSSQLTWYIRNETNTSVIDCFIRSGSPGHLNCSAPSARGSTTIFVNVTDGFYWDETSFVITVVNSPPTQGTPQITPASPAADDDLTCVPQSVTDVDGDSVLNITSWALNGASQLLVLMPFEGGSNTTFTRNYMPFGGNGTVSGAVWNSSDGRTGGAYIFNSSAPKIINLSYDIAFNMTDTQPFTVEAWVQVFGWNTSEPRAAIVDRLSNKGASATGWSLNVENASNGGVLRFFIKNATSGSSSETITGSSNIADGRWHHLAGVHDGTNFSIYVDGVLENSSVRRVWKSFNDDSGIDIGQWPGNPERYLNGSIDEVRLWNRSLSAEQILQHNASRYDLLDENETAVDDSWGCSVSPNDGYADGSTLNSSPVAVAGCSTPTDDYYVNRDTLFCSGTYPLADSTGNGVIIINASGVNVTCNGTVITGTDTGNDIGINLSTFGNLTLTGCTLANYSRGVYQESNGDKFTVINDTIVIGPARRINQVEGITLDADSINLTNVLVLNTTANGIRFLLSANSLLVNVRVEGTGTTAVTLSSVGLGVTVRNLTILNCSGTGLSLVSNKISVSNLTVRGCEGNSTSINGALVQETFEDVVIEHGKGIGISMEQSGASPLSGNTFARVRITNMSGRAIFLNYSVNNSFIGLNVTSSGDEGLYLRSGSTGNYINDSRFCSNGDAEQDINDSDSNTFTNVTCDDSTPGGLCAASCSGSFPNVTTPVFAPPAPTTIDNITANTTATDAQSNMTVYFRWLVDGVRVYNHTFSSVVNGSVLNATLGGGNFSRYQLVNVTVFANDSSLASENRSVEVNISNALPTQDAPSVTPASPTTDDNLTCNPQNVSDGDGDPIVNITNWYINNASITLLHLPFEGSSNNTYAKDYSDHGNNVKNNAGGPPFWNRTGGYTGGGMQFPANTNLTTTNGASDFSGADYYTVAAWIKPIGAAAGPGGGDVLRKEATAAMGVSNSAPPTLGAWRYSSGWCGSWALGARTLTFGQWYHAAFRYNGTHVSVFLNGSVDGQTGCAGKIDSNSNEMHVGGWSDEFFNGTIDEVLYFNRSLSDAQISSLFAGGLRTIHADTTTTGEQWTCATTPNDGYADGTMKNASVVVGAGNAAPLIVDVNFTAADPLENGTRSVFFSFNVSDTDGAGDLNHSTASVRILSNGIWRNSSSCSQSNYSATETRYNCTVLFNYYDNSSADWRVNASVRDNSSSLAFNDTLNFTYNSLSAMRLSLFTFDFGTLSLGQTAGSAANPLLANNTGNFDFAAINVTGYDLHGTSDRGYSIPAQNFTVNASADSIGLPLTNGTSALIPSGTLPHGAPGGAANRSLWLYVVMPSGGIIAQGYNATELWSLTVR